MDAALYRHGGDTRGFDGEIIADFSVNTNPLGYPDTLSEALSGLRESVISYPGHKAYDGLKGRLLCYEAGFHDGEVKNVLLGNGASELIHAIIHMLAPRRAVVAAPCFYGYERALKGVGAEIIYTTEEELAGTVEAKAPQLVCLCNPGNPMGRLIDMSLIEEAAKLCETIGAYLIVDECFLEFVEDFGRRTAARLIGQLSCIIVIRAFTKYFCMPGVRLGYAYVSGRLMKLCPENYLSEWNVSSVAVTLGMAALRADCGYRSNTLKLLSKERTYLTESLLSLGMSEISGEANYLFFKSERELFMPLLVRGILIRKCDNYVGLPKEGCYRIAIRTHKENEGLIKALREITG